MKTVRLTMAQAVVRYLANQRSMRDGKEVPLFANVGVYMDFAASSKGTEKAGN